MPSRPSGHLAPQLSTPSLSAWAAILVVPTLIGTVQGMDVQVVPELRWAWDHPAALALMVLGGVVLSRVSRRRGWL